MRPKSSVAIGTMVALMVGAVPAVAATAERDRFGMLPDGRVVDRVVLRNGLGVTAAVIAYGATLQSLLLPDAEGQSADVVLGYADLKGYVERPQYFGATVGRFANRIARGRFRLEGKEHQTPINNGVNALHGGPQGFDKSLWEVVDVRSGSEASVTLGLISKDGDQGYPGTLSVQAIYSLDELNRLTISYTATADRPTIVNITNHAFWNLSGEGSAASAMAHVLTIPADHYLPVDAGLIPTGERRPVAGGPFDFRSPRAISANVRDGRDAQIVTGRGYDHNWIVASAMTSDQRLMARVEDPVSGRAYELWANQPGLQFYSGNFLDGSIAGKAGKTYRQGDAIVLEPQLFPDSPNQTGFPSARLAPGETYRNTMSYRFTVLRPSPQPVKP